MLTKQLGRSSGTQLGVVPVRPVHHDQALALA
jgi:hypothetical protein